MLNSDIKTQAWAERVGLEAVKEGMKHRPGLLGLDGKRFAAAYGWGDGAPDFRDRLTEKACEIWVEDVARAVFSFPFEIEIRLASDGFITMAVNVKGTGHNLAASGWSSSLAEASIALVRDIRKPS